MLYVVAQFLGVLSFLGGSAAVAVAATGHGATPLVLVAQMGPQAVAEWIPTVANAIAAIGGALVALYASIRQARRKDDADDASIAANWRARFEDAQARLQAVTAERDELKAKLSEVAKPEGE